MDLRKLTALILCLLLLTGCGAQPAPVPTTEGTLPTAEATDLPVEVTDPTTLPTEPSTEATEPTVEVTDPSTEVTDPTEMPTDPTPAVTDPTVPVPTTPIPTVPVPTTPKPTAPKPTTPTAPKPTEPAPSSEELLYEKLFDPKTRVDINIRMSPQELQKMQDDYDRYSSFGSKSPIYRRADVTIRLDGVAYEIKDVGVRMKGNTSRMAFYDAQKGIYNGIHFKLDFQETFDDATYYGAEAEKWPDKELRKARKNRTFATLEKLELRWNKCEDASYIKELYAYDLYQSQGVLAPRLNLCSMDWSGVHLGVYTVGEPVDEVFLSKRLPAQDLGGDLYKCSGADFTGFRSVGIENEDEGKFYAYDLKSNKKTSQHASLKALINGLNAGTVTKERFAQLVDVDNFLSYAAVSWFAGNPDDLRNNYSNFYLYFLKSSGKAIIIPYDCDRVFGVAVHWDPSGHAMTRDDPFSAYRNDTGDQQKNPLYLYSVVAGGWYVRDFAKVLERVSCDPLISANAFGTRFQTAQRLYAQNVKPSVSLGNLWGLPFDLAKTAPLGSGSNLSYRDFMSRKLGSLPSFLARVDQYASSTPQNKEVKYYIRGDFNDWTDREEYRMTQTDGKLTYRLSFTREFRFKIYRPDTSFWIGTEALSPDTTVPYGSSGNTSIILQPGTYDVTYDLSTGLIHLKKV